MTTRRNKRPRKTVTVAGRRWIRINADKHSDRKWPPPRIQHLLQGWIYSK